MALECDSLLYLEYDVLEIDGNIAHQKAREVEDRIWEHIAELGHVCPARLGLLGHFYAGEILCQSDPLAITQLIVLYHAMSKMREMASEGVPEH